MIKSLLHIISLFLICFQSYGQVETLKVNVHIEQEDPTVSVDVFRCYLSNFVINSDDGVEHVYPNEYHLVDLEDEESMQFDLTWRPDTKIENISFLIGTDSIVNVSGAFDGDLDPIHGMYWTWNSGYINIKLEGSKKVDSGQQQFEFHIGGYAGGQATARKVTLSNVENSNELDIYIDLGKFLSIIDISKTGTVMSPGKKAVELADQFVKCVHE